MLGTARRRRIEEERQRRGEHPRARERASGAGGGATRGGGGVGADHANRMSIWRGGGGQPPALEMEQQLLPTLVPVSPAPGSVYTFQLRNVGLIRGLNLQVRGQISGGGTTSQSLTPLGLANILSLIDFQDYSTYHRITTQGWHLNFLQSRKREWPYLGASTTDNPTGIKNQNPSTPTLTSVSGNYAPSTIGASGNTKFQMTYRIPFARDRFDLRGSIWAKVTQASAFVFVTLNPNMFVTSTQDPSFAVYQSGGSDLATLSNVTLECYQDYLDQIPRGPDGTEAIPWGDLEQAYLLTSTVSPLLVQSQENSFAFTDQRQFLSTVAIFDNNTNLNFGTDVNYWALKSANLTPIFQRTPLRQLNSQREIFKDDLPPGVYFFDFMHRPIDTHAYGNVQLVANPSLVSGSASNVYLGYEMLGRIGAVARATAIPSGA